MGFGPEFSLTELSPALGAAVGQEEEPQQWCRGGGRQEVWLSRCPALLAPSAETMVETLEKVAWRRNRAIRVWKDGDKEYKESWKEVGDWSGES